MTIRFARREDLSRIVEIINQATYAGNANAFRGILQVEERMDWFKEQHPDIYPIYIAQIDGQLTGWASLSKYRNGRPALRKIAELSYYIDYAYHGRGIGTALIQHAIADCERLGFKHLVALLPEVNIPSISILRKFGFQQWGLLPNVMELEHQSCGHLIYGRSL